MQILLRLEVMSKMFKLVIMLALDISLTAAWHVNIAKLMRKLYVKRVHIWIFSPLLTPNWSFSYCLSLKVSLELLQESSNMVMSRLTMAPIHMEVGLKRSLPTGTLYLSSPSPIPWKRLDLSSVLELQCSTHWRLMELEMVVWRLALLDLEVLVKWESWWPRKWAIMSQWFLPATRRKHWPKRYLKLHL